MRASILDTGGVPDFLLFLGFFRKCVSIRQHGLHFHSTLSLRGPSIAKLIFIFSFLKFLSDNVQELVDFYGHCLWSMCKAALRQLGCGN